MPEKKIIFLHIGGFKTGTTAIQRFLYQVRDELKKNGILYSTTLSFYNHHYLPLSLIKEYTSFRAAWPAFEGSAEDLWSRTFQEIDQSECGKIIISSELFCDLVNENVREYSQHFKTILLDYFAKYDVRVICYLRDFFDYFLSRYKESIKVDPFLKLSFSDVFQEFLEKRSIHLFPSIFLDFYSGIFGQHNLLLRKYDRSSFQDGDVVADFCGLIGIHDSIYETGKARLSNMFVYQSIPDELIDLKRALNLVGIGGVEFNEYLSEVLINAGDLSKDKSYKSDKNGLELLEDEASKIYSRYGITLDYQFAFPSFHGRYSPDLLFQIALHGIHMKQIIELNSRIDVLNEKIDKINNSDDHTSMVHRVLRRINRFVNSILR